MSHVDTTTAPNSHLPLTPADERVRWERGIRTRSCRSTAIRLLLAVVVARSVPVRKDIQDQQACAMVSLAGYGLRPSQAASHLAAPTCR